jgi:hypothetical protein
MENNVITLSNRPNSVTILLSKIPEFRGHLDQSDLELPYVVFGLFAQYIQSLDVADPILERACELLNEFANSDDSELQNLIQVAVFETLVGNTRTSHIIEGCLRDKARELFHAAEVVMGVPGAE